ncbi:MAG: hypothetical protein MI725_15185 [Pirellulales bacterium]|nr:hypothetical protein [Pirellulales bacterium]
MDFFSIIKDAISVGASVEAKSRERQRATLDQLFVIDAELKRCTYLVDQEQARLIRRMRSLSIEEDTAPIIQSLEDVFSVKGAEIEALVSQVQLCIERAQASKFHDYEKLEPMISNWSATVSTLKDYLSGIVRQFDQVIDDARSREE